MTVVPALAAMVVLRTLARGASVLPSMRFTSVSCHVSGQVSFPALAAMGPRSPRGLQPRVSTQGTGRHGAGRHGA